MSGTRTDKPLHTHLVEAAYGQEGARSRDRRWLSLSKPVLVAAGLSGAVLMATLWHCASDSPTRAAWRPLALLQGGETGREGKRVRGAYTCE